ncbi:ecdysone-induced protein 74EF-like [Dreissena polymorpha]|uniref:ecdysone-induced protein 74EF-like n=1 Tax=Dreissena polymorpha TaxID=45954 RepID=UPI0022648F47|nr:ecdysone-induced protein 74EF-like [Dreissena polymorpha]
MQSQPPMEQMMQQNFSQSYSSSQNTAMMQALPQQANYISQAQPTQVPFSNTSSGRIPMQAGGMNPPNTLNMATGNYSRMGQTVGQSVMGGPATILCSAYLRPKTTTAAATAASAAAVAIQATAAAAATAAAKTAAASQQAALMAQLRHGGNAPPQMNSNYNQNQYPNY